MSTRTDIFRGPCLITFNSQKFRSKGDVRIVHQQEWFPVESSLHGVFDYHSGTMMDVIEFEPDGAFVVGALATMNPYKTKAIGGSVFGTDTPLTINSTDGKQRVYKAAAVLKPSDLTLSRKSTIFGSMQIGCLYAEDSESSDANSLFTDTTVSYPGDTSFDPATVLTQAYQCSWGSTAPFDSFYAKDGIKITHTLKLDAEQNERKGLFDYTFQGIEVKVSLQMEGPTPLEAIDLIKMQGTGAVMGRSLKAQSENLIIQAPGLYYILYKAGPATMPEIFSNKLRRMGEMELRATRNIVSGAGSALWYLASAA